MQGIGKSPKNDLNQIKSKSLPENDLNQIKTHF